MTRTPNSCYGQLQKNLKTNAEEKSLEVYTDFFNLIDRLEDPRSERYEYRLRDLRSSVVPPLRKLLTARTYARSKAKLTFSDYIPGPMTILLLGLGLPLNYFLFHMSWPPVGLVFTEILILAILTGLYFPKCKAEIRVMTALWNGRLVTIHRLLNPMLEDMDNLGLLLDIFHDSRMPAPYYTRRITHAAIVKLLPRVSDRQAQQFNSARRNILYHFLRDGREQVVIDALSAVAAVGDSRAVEKISPFVNKTSDNEREERIQAAALKSLEKLKARLERERSAESLLRPAEQPHSRAALLRPAKGAKNEDTEILLRLPNQ